MCRCGLLVWLSARQDRHHELQRTSGRDPRLAVHCEEAKSFAMVLQGATLQGERGGASSWTFRIVS